MDKEISSQPAEQFKAKRYRFHPLVRFLMLAIASLTFCLSLYFIFLIIPRYSPVSLFFKILIIIILFISGNTVYKHLTALNSVIIREERLELTFLLRKRIVIPWENLVGMEIYKSVKHYWRLKYKDDKGNIKQITTALAFPGIWDILLTIQDRKPDLELNDLLAQVLRYRRNIIDKEKTSSQSSEN